MIANNIGRYSKYIRPISILMDLMIISILGFYLFEYQIYNISYFIIYLIVGWIVVVFYSFYDVHRFITYWNFSKIVKQGVLFLLLLPFFPFSNNMLLVKNSHIVYNLVWSGFISKFTLFYFLKKYRIVTGSNFRNVVIIDTLQKQSIKKTFWS
jgi:putative colanic acid biosynthesis UDP-glucose lipid carrier transferase